MSSAKSVAELRAYFDTSAVLPLYREEPLTAAVEAAHDEFRPVISALTEVEVASAVARWVCTGELSSAQADAINAMFSEDVRTGAFEREELHDRHYWQARLWLAERKGNLRTLDALHLACCTESGFPLVTGDRLLADAAAGLGARVQLLSDDSAPSP